MKLGNELTERIQRLGLGRVAVRAEMTGLLLVIVLERDLDASDEQVAALQRACESLEAEAN